jgi:hypothetical protein
VLSSVSIQDGRSRSVTLTNDAMGQALRRDEADGNAWNPSTYNGGDPHEAWYRFNGRQMGSTGNNGTYDNSYAGSLSDRTHTIWGGPGAFRYGSTLGMSNVEFNDRLTPINTYSQGGAGGSYTVRNGDSLSTIAAQLWGDSSLWYLLAQANGLGGDGGLVAGQTLAIPGGVQRNTNNANTFKAYDPAQAFGDTSPTTPQPQKAKKSGCGTFGAILLVVIAVAVTTIATAGATSLLSGQAFGSVLGAMTGGSAAAGVSTAAWAAGGAIGGAVGSVASQGAGIAMGMQNQINWKGVALAGLSGGISGGLAAGGVFASAGKIAGAGLRGALGSVISQGIGVATRLQSKFDFAGVAAAGIAASTSALAGGKIGASSLSDRSIGNIAKNLLTASSGGIANATARSLINGTDFGDNILAALPDVIGSTIGRMVADGIASGGRQKAHGEPENLLPEGMYDPTPDPVVAAGAAVYGNAGAVDAVFVQVRDPGTGQIFTLDASGNLAVMPEFQDTATAQSTGWGDKWRETSPAGRRDSDNPAIKNAQKLLDEYLPLLEAIGVDGKDDGGLPGKIGPSISPSSEYVKRQVVELLVNRVIPDELNAGSTFGKQRTLIEEIQSAAYRALNGRQQMAFEYLTGNAGGSWSDAAAVGIIASLTKESFLDPGRRQGDYLGTSGPGIGLAQWELGDARVKLYNNIPGNKGYELGNQRVRTDFQVGRSAFFKQLSFINYELTNPQANGAVNYVRAGESLRGAGTAAEASAIVVRKYESPRHVEAEVKARRPVAVDIWNNFVQKKIIIRPRII